ncbi:MAG: Kelch repeat-containing protein [Planctomycetota bacterium]|jgi:hypothetical protein
MKHFHRMIPYLCAALIFFAAMLTGCDSKKKEHHDEREAAAVGIGVGSWKPISTDGVCPKPRVGNTIVYTGTEIIIWGGWIGEGTQTNTGGIYNIQEDVWRATSTGTNCPSDRVLHTAIWTGDRMIVWGGYDYQNGAMEYYGDGAAYFLDTDTWTVINNSGDCPSRRCRHSAVWTGDAMIIWGGVVDDFTVNREYMNSGAAYNPILDSWKAISIEPDIPTARCGHSAFWTGNRMLIYGGHSELVMPPYNITLYDPLLDSWENLSGVWPMEGHSVVWTGESVISWSGVPMFCGLCAAQNSGSIFYIDNSSWASTSTGENCPSGRIQHTAVWTGDKMIIWGGSMINDGGIYDPKSDTWEATKRNCNTPLSRYNHSAIWVGDSMFIWGGTHYNGVDNIMLNTGGIFTP